jgi:hypothetical protein
MKKILPLIIIGFVLAGCKVTYSDLKKYEGYYVAEEGNEDYCFPNLEIEVSPEVELVYINGASLKFDVPIDGYDPITTTIASSKGYLMEARDNKLYILGFHPVRGYRKVDFESIRALKNNKILVQSPDKVRFCYYKKEQQ